MERSEFEADASMDPPAFDAPQPVASHPEPAPPAASGEGDLSLAAYLDDKPLYQQVKPTPDMAPFKIGHSVSLNGRDGTYRGTLKGMKGRPSVVEFPEGDWVEVPAVQLELPVGAASGHVAPPQAITALNGSGVLEEPKIDTDTLTIVQSKGHDLINKGIDKAVIVDILRRNGAAEGTADLPASSAHNVIAEFDALLKPAEPPFSV